MEHRSPSPSSDKENYDLTTSSIDEIRRTKDEYNGEEETVALLELIVGSGDDDSHNTELGCQLWTAALLLSGWIRRQQNSDMFNKGKRVLEIGAGLGVGGFTVASLFRDSSEFTTNVVITDCGLQTLKKLQDTRSRFLFENKNKCFTTNSVIEIRRHLWEEDLEYLEANHENRKIDFIHHWSKAGNEWDNVCPTLGEDSLDVNKNDDEKPSSSSQFFDLIVGSDLLYFSCQERPLMAALQRWLRPNGGKAIIVQTMRTNNVSVFDRFLQSVRDDELSQLQVVEVADIHDPEDYCSPRVLTMAKETKHTTGYKLVTIIKP